MNDPTLDAITPHPEGYDTGELDQVHERAYVVRSYRKGDELLVIRGAVRDQKPPDLYVPEDPEPLTVHHMLLDLHVALPTMEVVHAHAVMEVHPHSACPRITEHYEKLIGLVIGRGFTHRVRELFGGPRGCSHTTALLQAMAPVALQSLWSFRASQLREERLAGRPSPLSPFADPGSRERVLSKNLNTCHVWADDGERVAAARAGEPLEIPLWITNRYQALGRDLEEWIGD